MPVQKLDKTEVQSFIKKLSHIQRVRQKTLEVLVRIDKKAGRYKVAKLTKKLKDLTK